MINRISVNVLLKSVIAIMAAAVVVVFLTSAWQSWNRLISVNRIAAVADVSGDLFTALHNLRVDRATTARDLNSDEKFASLPGQLKEVRSGDMPALKSAVAKLATADVLDRQNIFNSLSQSVMKLVELHQQTEAALAQPKSARPAGLAKEYFTATTALMDLLDKTSTQLTNSVKLEDSYIDQLMELKQLAWITRNAGGDASVVISNALGGLPLPPDPMTLYQVNLAKVDTAWTALEDLASGLPVPARFKNSLDEAKREFFGADYTQLRMKTLKQLIVGEKVSTSADAWSQMRLALGMSFDDGTGRTIHFDADNLFFFGHSQGGLTGPAFIAFEPTLKGAVLSGTGGILYLSLLYKTAPVSFPELILSVTRDNPIDEDNPTLALAQMWIERADGANYARLMVRHPPASNGPKNIFQTEGFTDTYAPNPAIEAFATSLGGDIVRTASTMPVEGLTLRGRTVVDPPVTDNLAGVTAVLAQYNQQPGSDGHFVVFDIPAAQKQSAEFLGTLARTGHATVVSP